MPVDHAIVFGDSLSDIGRKWKTKLGGFAAWKSDGELRLLNTSATGRFSDSKNWTDYMFEATSGKSLVSESLEGTISASGEHHRLSSRWIHPPGAPPFRFANYAVGGAVGWKAAQLKNKIGLTTFSDQVDEFEADFAAVSQVDGIRKREFLFIVMFGSNDIYTDEKDSNVSAEIGAGIIEQCDRLTRLIANNNALDQAHFVIAGAAYPNQSIYYTSQLESLKVQESRELGFLRRAIAANPGFREIMPSEDDLRAPRRDYERKVAGLHGQVATLNRCVKSHCAKTPQFHYFSMRIALLALRSKAADLGINPDKAQTIAQYNKISPGMNWVTEKKDYIHFHNENNDALKVDGLFPLFTADQKHPTSRGYKALWGDMESLLKTKKLGFGNIVPDADRVPSPVIKKAYWQNDAEVHTCQKCQVKFSTFTRRHHCRKCGGIFCDKCSKRKATLDYPLTDGGQSARRGVKDCRVCETCYAALGG